MNNTAENYPLFVRLFFFTPAYIAFAKQSILSHYFLAIAVIAVFFPTYFAYLIPVFAILLVISFFLKFPNYDGVNLKKFGFFKTWILHPIEAFTGYMFFLVIKLFPVKIVSSMGSSLGSLLGKLFRKRTKLAFDNLTLAYPEKTDEEKKEIIKNMWKNFGRMIFEIPHLKFFYKNEKYLRLEGEKNITSLPNHRIVALFGHFNSVGMISIPFARINFPCSVIYRFPNNPVTVDLIQQAFGKGVSDIEFFPKSRWGIKKSLDFLKQGLPVAIAPDQHFSRGKPLKFFGKTAMTSTVAVKMARHFDCPILPIQIIREKGIKHKLVVHKPIYFKGDSEKATTDNMQKINDIIEDWVRQHPDQWMWFHHRWGKNK